MSILNLVIVHFADTTTDDARQNFESLLHELRLRCDGVLRWEQGSDAGLVPGSADYGAAILFEDEHALETFLVDPVHVATVEHLSRMGAAWTYMELRLP